MAHLHETSHLSYIQLHMLEIVRAAAKTLIAKLIRLKEDQESELIMRDVFTLV